MPLPEGYLPREGDVLILHCKVRHDVYHGESDVHLAVGDRYGHTVVNLNKVAGIFSRHFKPEEIVRSIGDLTGQTGEVVAVHEGFVWVKDGNGAMQTIAVNELEPAPALDQPFVEAVRSPAAAPLGGARTPEPFCEPAPVTDQEQIDRIG